MKELLMTTLILSTSAFASHRIDCDIKAEVVGVKNLNRLNDSSAFRRAFANKPAMDTRAQIVTISVVEITKQNSTPGCGFGIDQELSLYVKQDENLAYPVGTTLDLNYRNMGSALGSNISWTVLK